MNEAQLEQTTLDWLRGLGWKPTFGPDIAPDGPAPERAGYDQVILAGRLHDALARINPALPPAALDDALRQIIRSETPSLVENNRRFHRLLTDGVDVAYLRDGREVHDKVWLIDLDDLANNDWLAVNQYTVSVRAGSRPARTTRRPDIVLFVNGLPLAVIELKNPEDENATLHHAFNQLQTYKADIPGLFVTNELLVISDGLAARTGTLTSGWDRFMPWRTIDGSDLYREPGNEKQSDLPAPSSAWQAGGILQPGLQTVIHGVFERRRFLDLIHNFVVFEDDGAHIAKKAAAYHQFHAVNKALECTLSACGIDADPGLLLARFPKMDAQNPFVGTRERGSHYGPDSDHFGSHKIGVVWHTQGSGKSLLMVFFAGKVIRHPAMENPTLVVITDRNDLDDQLFATFSACRDLIRQTPVQAGSREHLRRLLTVPAGGVVFSTIQKFFPDAKGARYPQLSDRRNIVVIADEAHRSQYDFIDGFARHMHDALPNASFIGFTGTPIERDDRSTPAVFGDYIDKYDILRAVEDGATVPIYYESRLAKLELREEEKPRIDPAFEEITEGEEEETRQKLRTKWAALEAMVGADKRIALVAEDLVQHFENRLAALDGKAMIVCMSRRICVDMYSAIVELRPDWHSNDDAQGTVKVVMSGSASDRLEWQPHIRNKAGREALANRFKDPDDPLQIVIVRDMWLTGFDCPAMHTMYVDKPMRGHGLMQAIARVNRVFKDKPGGLVVDYLGLADQLKRALADYTEAGGRGSAAIDQEQAVAVMQEKVEVVRAMFFGFDYASLLEAPPAERMGGIAAAMDHILQLEDGKKRYLTEVTALSKAFALAVPHEAALAARDEVGFFQAVRSGLAKMAPAGDGKPPDELDFAIHQLVSRAVSSDEVIDIFAAAGLKNPDISILSDDFLQEVRQLPHRNLAVELLRKLLHDEIKARGRKNVVQARSFAEMLEQAVRRYQNRAIEAAQVIEELIQLAQEMREARRRGEELGLSEDEVAFYDALEVNDSAVQVLGDETLKAIAQELVQAVRRSVTIDWNLRENARAQIRVIVKQILRKYGYPPDKQEKATQTVLEQAEVLCQEWVTV